MIKYWEVKAAANKTGELLLYGDISDSRFWGDEVTPLQIDADLKALGDIDTLNVYCNSGGGSVFAGMAIHNIIKRHKAKSKVAYVDGLAASIASVIIMACDKVHMFSNSLIMIHNPAAIAIGSADEFRKMADTLDKVRDTISAVYEEKTGQDAGAIEELMNAETWMNADDALAGGFADEIEKEKKMAASLDGKFLDINGQRFDLDRYQNRPRVEPVDAKPPGNTEQPEPTITAADGGFLLPENTLPEPVSPVVPELEPAILPNDSGGESRPVSEIDYTELRKKIHTYS